MLGLDTYELIKSGIVVVFSSRRQGYSVDFVVKFHFDASGMIIELLKHAKLIGHHTYVHLLLTRSNPFFRTLGLRVDGVPQELG